MGEYVRPIARFMNCCSRTRADDDSLRERWELSFSPSRCLSNIKLLALALLLSFYASAHLTAVRYYWKLIFSFSFTVQELCRSSCSIKYERRRRWRPNLFNSTDFHRCWTDFINVCVATAGYTPWYINCERNHREIDIHFHCFSWR